MVSTCSHQDQSLFLDVKEDLLKRFWSSWDGWRQFALQDAISALRNNLVGDSLSALLSSNRLTAWETVEIKDEDESEANGMYIGLSRVVVLAFYTERMDSRTDGCKVSRWAGEW